ncbi:MAG: helix-turn-helix domain-containing protein [bacterium]
MKLRLEKKEREAIGARLREIRLFNKLEQTELASRAGLSQAIISQYEKGLTEVSLSFIQFLAKSFGISGDWLIFGTGSSPYEKARKEIQVRLMGNLDKKSSRSKGGFCGVPLVDPKAAASPGKVHSDRVSEWEIVRMQEAANRNNLVALTVRAAWGKNMNPPFEAGSRIIIDRDDKTVRRDAYYAVNTQAAKKSPRDASVNAIRKLNLSGSRLWFVEDNPVRDFEYVDLKSRERLDDVIIGRVIWVWQKLS